MVTCLYIKLPGSLINIYVYGIGCEFGWMNLAEKRLDVDKKNKRMWNQKCGMMESVEKLGI